MQIRRRPPASTISASMFNYQVPMPDAQPHNILEEIVWYKEGEVTRWRERLPLVTLQKQITLIPPPLDFLAALRDGATKPALIAEVKKASPSKGVIREDFDPVTIAQDYAAGGASCLSVLTDSKFFQGSFENLQRIRSAVAIPLLCKEFIIYPYQIYYARYHGADAVLLIAAILSDQDLRYFTKIIKSLGMIALIEVHTAEELDQVLALSEVSLIGINNRNLEDFSVDLQTTQRLLATKKEIIQERGILVVSESGIHGGIDLEFVLQSGVNAVLVGESLVKQADIRAAIATLFAGYFCESP
ncbi:MAG: indole-3-glycerol phosphate synthase TrpC [Coleofasciculaceae cyanobacterium SM2_1_6]|nr:indole-3-glycerol phosphate synthase TrpC [Coleofasciculaceae cyanobacterium SM2_1_6]